MSARPLKILLRSLELCAAQLNLTVFSLTTCSLPGQNVAVVTSCSHIFCVDCANAFLGSPPSCHVCHAKLEDSYDLVQAELHPADLWKSLILAGLPPPVIIDIASRALSFWNYQQDHEKMYQTVLANHAEKRVAILEKELNESKRKNEADNEYLGKDLEIEKRKTQQCRELNARNTKAYAKLKTTNEQLKRQILLGANPMSNANLHYDAPLPSPATHASRIPFVPANNTFTVRPQGSSLSAQPQPGFASHNDSSRVETSSTRSFFSDPEQNGLGNAQPRGVVGGRGNHSSRSNVQHSSSDEGDHRAQSSRPPEIDHSRSRSHGQSHMTIASVAHQVGGVTLTEQHRGGGKGGAHHENQPVLGGPGHSRRPSSTATFATTTTGLHGNFFNQQSASVQPSRGGGTVSAGAFRPASFDGRLGPG
ncbi:hypothetical protein JCM3766R1_004031 [Sporobolomyces carnicolor]